MDSKSLFERESGQNISESIVVSQKPILDSREEKIDLTS